MSSSDRFDGFHMKPPADDDKPAEKPAGKSSDKPITGEPGSKPASGDGPSASGTEVPGENAEKPSKPQVGKPTLSTASADAPAGKPTVAEPPAAPASGAAGTSTGLNVPAERRSQHDRRKNHRIQACYQVGEDQVSILDLLRRFNEEQFMVNGISSLADLHVKVGEPVHYRHDGDVVPHEGAEICTEQMVKALVYPLLRRDQIEDLEQELPKDVDAAFHLEEEEGMNFRINAFYDRDGMAAVIRALPRHIPDITSLGFPNFEVLQDILRMRQGLVIVSGITGSGKSTTIASILQEMNRTQKLRIITLEDPCEYVLEGDQCLISQREVGGQARSFQGGLRSALREDPDVIFVGEIRDIETANLALSAAETGHVVFSTLHTKDAKGVVTRMVDLFPPERSKEVQSQMSFSIAYVIAQKLLPRKSGAGRVAAYEIMKNSASVGNLIRSGNWHQIYSTMQLSAKDNMITLEKHLEQLVRDGVVTKDAALQYANDPSHLQALGSSAMSFA